MQYTTKPKNSLAYFKKETVNCMKNSATITDVLFTHLNEIKGHN